MTDIKNIIFDWDNTLFPFKEKYWESAHRKLFKAAYVLEEEALDQFMVKYHEFDEQLWPKVHAHQLTIAELREERLRLTLKHFGKPIDESEVKGFFAKFLLTLFDEICPDPVLLEAMQQLSKNYNIALLSNGGHVEQREKLRRAGFDGLFPTYISGETGFLKPDPRAFTHLLEKESFEASETLMVGDLVEHDILPAQSLGLKTAYLGPKKGTGADFEYRTLAQFFKAFLK